MIEQTFFKLFLIDNARHKCHIRDENLVGFEIIDLIKEEKNRTKSFIAEIKKREGIRNKKI